MAARARKVKEAAGDKTYVPSKDIAEDLPTGIDTLVLVPPRNGGPSVPGKRSNKVAPVALHDPTVSSSSESGMSSRFRQPRVVCNTNHPPIPLSQSYHCSLQTLDPTRIRPQRVLFPHRDHSFE